MTEPKIEPVVHFMFMYCIYCCKAEFQPKTARRLRFSCDGTKHGKLVSFFSIQPTFRQYLYTKESIKKLNTIAKVAYNVSYTNYRDERIEN